MSNEINVKDYIISKDKIMPSDCINDFFIENLPLYDSEAGRKRAAIVKSYLKGLKKEINEAGTNDMPEDLIKMYEDLKIMFSQIVEYEERIVEKGRR